MRAIKPRGTCLPVSQSVSQQLQKCGSLNSVKLTVKVLLPFLQLTTNGRTDKSIDLDKAVDKTQLIWDWKKRLT